MTCVIGSSVTSAIAFSILSPIVGGADDDPFAGGQEHGGISTFGHPIEAISEFLDVVPLLGQNRDAFRRLGNGRSGEARSNRAEREE